jgi:myosin protein heavy chain
LRQTIGGLSQNIDSLREQKHGLEQKNLELVHAIQVHESNTASLQQQVSMLEDRILDIGENKKRLEENALALEARLKEQESSVTRLVDLLQTTQAHKEQQEHELAEIRKERDTLLENIKQHEIKVSELSAEVSAKETAIQIHLDQITSRNHDISELTRKEKEFREQLEKLEQGRVAAEQRCKQVESDIVAQGQSMAALREQLLESNNRIELEHTKAVHFEQQCGLLDSSIKDKQQENTRLVAQLNELEIKYAENRKISQELEVKTGEIKKQKDSLETELQIMDSKKTSLENEVNDVWRQNKDMMHQITTIKRDLRESQSQGKVMVVKQSSFQQTIQQLEGTIEVKDKEYNDLSQQMDQTRQQLASVTAENRAIHKQLYELISKLQSKHVASC